METHQKLGSSIRQFRQIRGITQEQLATQLNMTQQAYHKLEAGETDIKLSRLEEIAQVLDTTVSTLLEFDASRVVNSFTNSTNGVAGTNHGTINLGLPEWKELFEELRITKEQLLVSKDAEIRLRDEQIAQLKRENEQLLRELNRRYPVLNEDPAA